ncbi:MAG: phosphoribosylformylglycinamidine synthase subunit PurL, partial [FCB group bacterium]|nr:phosphoribosylformylglycinamidine synthase subunit PurL [FCB group bacterium]
MFSHVCSKGLNNQTFTTIRNYFLGTGTFAVYLNENPYFEISSQYFISTTNTITYYDSTASAGGIVPDPAIFNDLNCYNISIKSPLIISRLNPSEGKILPEPQVDLDLALEHGLNEEEYERILNILGRTPTYTELGIFSVMWSEHCSYKNSVAELKKLPREGKHLLADAGEENAGLVDIGNGLAAAFKIESHNHPSALEPYQGAATGVGGIMRDIFSMGARPIAGLDSLRFGSIDDPHTRYLFDGVVEGIADYGNCLGIPTVAGEIYFEDSYKGNPLINVMSVGVVNIERIIRATSGAPGNSVFILGSTTGRDGIHGATFASEELDENSAEDRSSVQVGDPFTEKLLLEATLEISMRGTSVGVQDMGAAGITCSTTEMSARGETGMEIDLDKVHLREKGMIPYEILLSESQERMLIVCLPEKESELAEIAEKWELPLAKIGKTTDDGNLKVFFQGDLAANLPCWDLVLGGGAPVYHREYEKPEYLDRLSNFDLDNIPEINPQEALLKLLTCPDIADKGLVYHQYDHSVRAGTLLEPGYSDAAVIRIPGSNRGLAMKTDGNGRLTYLDPFTGGAMAVCEAARNVVCAGAEPVAVTNCLNFGNPYKPEIFYQFREAVRGMGEACKILNTPVTGGNVSFYNQNPEGAVFPTPVIGMLGLLDDLDQATSASFKTEGDQIYLLGKGQKILGGSSYLKVIAGEIAGKLPELDLEMEKLLQKTVLKAIKSGLVNSAHDISDGGLAVALAECCIADKKVQIGAEIELDDSSFESLFNEAPSQIILSISPGLKEELELFLEESGLPFRQIGRV